YHVQPGFIRLDDTAEVRRLIGERDRDAGHRQSARVGNGPAELTGRRLGAGRRYGEEKQQQRDTRGLSTHGRPRWLKRNVAQYNADALGEGVRLTDAATRHDIQRRGRKGRKVRKGFLCGLRGLCVPVFQSAMLLAKVRMPGL